MFAQHLQNLLKEKEVSIVVDNCSGHRGAAQESGETSEAVSIDAASCSSMCAQQRRTTSLKKKTWNRWNSDERKMDKAPTLRLRSHKESRMSLFEMSKINHSSSSQVRCASQFNRQLRTPMIGFASIDPEESTISYIQRVVDFLDLSDP